MTADVGGGELIRRQHENPRDVHGHVAVAHHHHALAAEVEREVALVGAGVVPAHEVAGAVASRQVLAGNSQAAVGPRAHAVDDRVEVLEQVLVLDVRSELHVATEAEVGVRGDLVVHPGDRLDLGVVGRDAGAHQAEGCGQAIEHVHLHVEVILRQHVLSGVEPGRA